jgi:hypothetical protein
MEETNATIFHSTVTLWGPRWYLQMYPRVYLYAEMDQRVVYVDEGALRINRIFWKSQLFLYRWRGVGSGQRLRIWNSRSWVRIPPWC